MLIADVNVFVYAHRRESPRFDDHRSWLRNALVDVEPFGVSEAVLASFIRIVTNHRIYREPTSPQTALDFCAVMLAAPSAVPIRPGPRHWAIFADLCLAGSARANLVPDAYLAAMAIENGATWVTNDRGFARFPGLRWQVPLPA